MVRTLSIAVWLLLILLPVGSGLFFLLVTSFHSETGVSSATFTELLTDYESTVSSLLLAVVTPLLACYLALWMAPGLLQKPRLQQVLSPLLSIPHVAFAVGLMLLLSPSGWLIRLVETLSGLFPAPPAGWPLPSKSLVTVIVVLVLKELPFLLLMISAQLKQLPVNTWLTQAQSYGYSKRQAWWRVVAPELLRRLTLPMAAVIIYTLSVIDIPLLVGSNTPGVLAQRVYEWTFQFSADSQVKALAGAWILLAMAVVLLLFNSKHAALFRALALSKEVNAGRESDTHKASRFAWSLLGILALGVILILVLQSAATHWFYPNVLPADLSLERWQTEWRYLAEPVVHSLWLALASALLGTVSAIALLQRQRQKGARDFYWPVLIALFIPQVPLVLGWQRLLGEHLQGGWQLGWVFWSHAVYTLPYAYLVLHGAYVSFDKQWLTRAESLGYSPRAAWWRVMLPMLKQPVAVAFAVAFSVSIAQYLPTQWLGQGLTPTLTTEAVSIASGGDWRIGSLYALLQMVLPLLVFILVGAIRTKSYAEHS
ncbi:ABC transporter permease subunit [Idiomarina sp. HP20-50]|uniref:ABC transporter permease subunit n=1 Tax=Idiomarina sp. HP20-50 TaxID=3070813 RepID=UPI00294B76DF|nr:ABC transporter permease subunit [Idiomarina sp. HP20-50]MDV6317002.1 ABC transporter permease [Idiomarina sp. HP20-50]